MLLSLRVDLRHKLRFATIQPEKEATMPTLRGSFVKLVMLKQVQHDEIGVFLTDGKSSP
jgi:hypothetical protein